MELPNFGKWQEENQQVVKNVDGGVGENEGVDVDALTLVHPVPLRPEVVDGRALADNAEPH